MDSFVFSATAEAEVLRNPDKGMNELLTFESQIDPQLFQMTVVPTSGFELLLESCLFQSIGPSTGRTEFQQ